MVFALELTHDVNMLLPLLLAVTIAHGFTVLTLRRSILTEKISRRGYHSEPRVRRSIRSRSSSRAKSIRTSVVALPADATAEGVAVALGTKSGARHQQRLFPVIDETRRLVGVVTRGDLRAWLIDSGNGAGRPLGAAIETSRSLPTRTNPCA